MKIKTLAAGALLVLSSIAWSSPTMTRNEARRYDQSTNYRNGSSPIVINRTVNHPSGTLSTEKPLQREEARSTASTKTTKEENWDKQNKKVHKQDGDTSIYSGPTERRYNAHDSNKKD